MPDVDRLPRGVVGQAPLPKEPLQPQLVHRQQGLLDGRVVVGGVEVEEVYGGHPGVREHPNARNWNFWPKPQHLPAKERLRMVSNSSRLLGQSLSVRAKIGIEYRKSTASTR